MGLLRVGNPVFLFLILMGMGLGLFTPSPDGNYTEGMTGAGIDWGRFIIVTAGLIGILFLVMVKRYAKTTN